MSNNTHGIPDTFKEVQSVCGDWLPPCLMSTTWPTVPVPPGLALPAFATRGYVPRGVDLVYVEQEAAPVTLSGADGTYWLALTADTYTDHAPWTRQAGTAYVWRAAATRPADTDGLLTFASCTVAGGAVTAVTPVAGITAPMAQQMAHAVAITDGRISLGGHASTCPLDVQSSVEASDIPTQYMGVRLWPVVPAGASTVMAAQVQQATGAGLAGAFLRGFRVQDQPTELLRVRAFEGNIAAGADRWNIFCDGTASNYFVGAVGIGATPVGAKLSLGYDRAGAGINIFPSDNTGPGSAIAFYAQGVPGVVGSITTTTTTTAYNTTSDRRLKEAITALTGALDVVRALRPVQFRWRSTGDVDQGFIADEVQEVVPGVVTGAKEAVDEGGAIVPQGMDPGKLVVWLTGACQELATQVAALQARLAHLEASLGV